MKYRARKLSAAQSDFENERWRHYASVRGSRLDTRAREAWELFHNNRDDSDTQYTKKQLATLEEVGAPPVSMNYMYPILSQQKAMLSVDTPMGRIVPEGGDADKAKAYIFDKLCGAIWRRAKAKAAYQKAVKEMLVCGISALIVEPKEFYKPGMFELTISHVAWNELFIDPTSKDTGLCFRDAEAIYVAKRIPRRKVENIYGIKVSDDRNTLFDANLPGVDDEETDNRYTLIRDIYEKKAGFYVLARAVKDGEEFFTRRIVTTEKEVEAFNQGEWSLVDTVHDTFVRRRTIIADDILALEVMLPLTEYPLAIFTPDDYDSPYLRSPAEFLREPQKAANKFYQLVLLNAALASNTRFMGPKGSFVDKDAWERYGSAAGHTYEYKADPTLPNAGKPEIIAPLPLNSAFYQLSSDLKYFMEYNSGTPGVLQGDSASSPETFSTVQSLQNHASARSRDMRGRVEFAITFLWKAVMDYIQYYGDREQIVRYMDDADEELTVIPLDTVLDDREIVTYDVQASIKTYYPTDRQELVKLLQSAVSQIGDPNAQRFILQETLRNMDYPVADKILKQMDVLADLSNKNADLTDQIDRLNKLVDQLSREVLINKQQVTVKKTEGDLKAITASTQARAEAALGRLEDPVNKQQPIPEI
jgi:hypothetical protein